jgi:hypothetical protein
VLLLSLKGPCNEIRFLLQSQKHILRVARSKTSWFSSKTVRLTEKVYFAFLDLFVSEISCAINIYAPITIEVRAEAREKLF